MKKIKYHNQLDFIPEMQGEFNIKKIKRTLHKNRFNEKSHKIISVDTMVKENYIYSCQKFIAK